MTTSSEQSHPNLKDSRLVALATALIHGAHFGQILRHEKGPAKGDPELFGRGSLSLEQVTALQATFFKLAKTPSERIVAWTKGADDADVSSMVDELKAVPIPSSERLPVNAAIALMKRRLTGPEEFFVRAVANLIQLCAEVHYDGTYLQDLYRIYIALGINQLALPTDDAGQIAVAKELSQAYGKTPFAPFEPTPEFTYEVVKKLVNWIQKNSGQRDVAVVARELMEDPEVKALLPRLKALKPRRIAFLGHSMMMSLHWSSFGSWSDIAAQVVSNVNPGMQFGRFQGGGLTASRAIKEHLPALIPFKPDETIILVFIARPGEVDAFDSLLQKLTEIKTRIVIVNDVRPFSNMSLTPEAVAAFESLSAKYNATLLDFQGLGAKAPGNETWAAVDMIHMGTEAHIFYAKALLKLWAQEE